MEIMVSHLLSGDCHSLQWHSEAAPCIDTNNPKPSIEAGSAECTDHNITGIYINAVQAHCIRDGVDQSLSFQT